MNNNNKSELSDAELERLSPEERLKYFITKTKNVVQKSIQTHKDRLQVFRDNPEKMTREVFGNENEEVSATLSQEEKKRLYTLVEDQICLTLFSTEADLKQLGCCLNLLPISMQYAVCEFGFC